VFNANLIARRRSVFYTKDMAKLPALVRALLPLDGREYPTLDLIARTVREAGLISTTKRGSGASEMTARDAANLLIGMHAVQSPKLAAHAVVQFRPLRRLARPDGEADALPNGTGHKAIRDAETFGEALDALIEWIGNIDFQFMGVVPDPPKDFDYSDKGTPNSPRVWVDFVSTPLARITIAFDRRLFDPGIPPAKQTFEYGLGPDQPTQSLDRVITVRVGSPTIHALNDALRSSLLDERDAEKP
jgi:hypothetical protein